MEKRASRAGLLLKGRSAGFKYKRCLAIQSYQKGMARRRIYMCLPHPPSAHIIPAIFRKNYKMAGMAPQNHIPIRKLKSRPGVNQGGWTAIETESATDATRISALFPPVFDPKQALSGQTQVTRDHRPLHESPARGHVARCQKIDPGIGHQNEDGRADQEQLGKAFHFVLL